MEYKRKHRWSNYGSFKCKEYLRNDFLHECAYCKLHEQEVGLIGTDYFEIDHFKPQTLETPDTHKYFNLYYCCEDCNSKKSDTWDTKLLDPCVDDIFGGSTPAIIGGTRAENFQYIAKNDRGTFYINTFKLNSTKRINLREAREKNRNNIHTINSLINQIVIKINSSQYSDDIKDLVMQLEQLQKMKMQELDSLPKNELFEKLQDLLNQKHIKNSIVFDEYNMDIKVTFNNATYCCEVIVDDTEVEQEKYAKFISIDKLNVWFEKLSCSFGILYYFSKLEKVYFYPISDLLALTDFTGKKSSKQIILDNSNIID